MQTKKNNNNGRLVKTVEYVRENDNGVYKIFTDSKRENFITLNAQEFSELLDLQPPTNWCILWLDIAGKERVTFLYSKPGDEQSAALMALNLHKGQAPPSHS